MDSGIDAFGQQQDLADTGKRLAEAAAAAGGEKLAAVGQVLGTVSGALAGIHGIKALATSKAILNALRGKAADAAKGAGEEGESRVGGIIARAREAARQLGFGSEDEDEEDGPAADEAPADEPAAPPVPADEGPELLDEDVAFDGSRLPPPGSSSEMQPLGGEAPAPRPAEEEGPQGDPVEPVEDEFGEGLVDQGPLEGSESLAEASSSAATQASNAADAATSAIGLATADATDLAGGAISTASDLATTAISTATDLATTATSTALDTAAGVLGAASEFLGPLAIVGGIAAGVMEMVNAFQYHAPPPLLAQPAFTPSTIE